VWCETLPTETLTGELLQELDINFGPFRSSVPIADHRSAVAIYLAACSLQDFLGTVDENLRATPLLFLL
jgi:hypothetical protein